MLLRGAVIGSVSDLGLVSYNPARMALIEIPAFVVTAKTHQWDKARRENGLRDGVDLKDSNFGAAATLAAGAFDVPFLKGHRFAYAFLTRRRDETDVLLWTEGTGRAATRARGSWGRPGRRGFRSCFHRVHGDLSPGELPAGGRGVRHLHFLHRPHAGRQLEPATDRLDRPLDFPDGNDDPIVGSGEMAKYHLSRWRFLLGFSFPFADQLRDGRKNQPGGLGACVFGLDPIELSRLHAEEEERLSR